MDSRAVVIIANGQFPTHPIPLNILKNAQKIICCDGAVDKLLNQTRHQPDVIIGDLDSISDEAKLKFSDRLIFVVDQESNDLTKAFNYASQDKNKIIFLGTTGGREDHTLSNFFLMMNFAKQADITIFTDHGVFTSMIGLKKLESFRGQQISFFTENSKVVVDCHSLKWPLSQKIFVNPWQGSLNQSVSDQLEVQVTNGSCLVFQQYFSK
jgi:thiamine pyrophosphokinase